MKAAGSTWFLLLLFRGERQLQPHAQGSFLNQKSGSIGAFLTVELAFSEEPDGPYAR